MPRAFGVPRRVRHAIVSLALLFGVGLGFETGFAQERSGGWAFTSLPQANLWFHGMALVDPIGPGPTPLYDPGYPNEVRRAKESAGLPPTALDRRSAYFREAFQRDPAFEVLHFLPLYFADAGRTEAFAALRLLAGTEEGIPRAPSSRTSFGVMAVGSVLTTPSQRSILGEFVTALEQEWDSFLGPFWQGESAQREQLHISLQDAWRRLYAPVLAPFLDGLGMSGGIVALVPAIGAEGRIFAGDPQNRADNVLVVSAPTGPDRASDGIFSMLRELSFPLVRRVMDRTADAAGSRDEEERLAATAAIRSGALILERYRPDDLFEYHRFFLSQAGRSVPAEDVVEATFREVFSLEAGLEAALREEILNMATNGGTE